MSVFLVVNLADTLIVQDRIMKQKIAKADFDRYEIVNLLKGQDLVGIELGVASGDFSRRMVASGKFSRFFGVDMYADHHDTAEYVSTLKSIGIFAPYHLLRMRFDEAIELFPDQSLDFVYIDGYAHNGEDGGNTICSWLDKVKIGGIIAGHDYHKDWPLVIEGVDDLCQQTGLQLHLTQHSEKPGIQDHYPSWFMVKDAEVKARPSEQLLQKSEKVNQAIKKRQLLKARLKRPFQWLLEHISK